ncbi:MAG: acetate kinase [Desulfobacteraceae bacterium]|nr:acetate kinase [Desulfobacteraceae bacterium]
MDVLVINSGSSSVKYKVFSMPEERLLAAGRVENIGIGNSGSKAVLIQNHPEPGQFREEFHCTDHADAVSRIFAFLDTNDAGMPGGTAEIGMVGHRVVHGGSRFSKPVIISTDVLAGLEQLAELAPLHIPLNVACIKACREVLPETPMAACFDTAFSYDLPHKSRFYPVPMEWYEKQGIRRYGFHGISYEYAVAETANRLGASRDRLKIIAAHLGNGSSIMAFDRGRVLDTSMGFTPLEGLMMGTRSGDFDPAVFPYIMEKTGMSVEHILDTLNTRSGLLGISGVSRDMREIEAQMDAGDPRARLAFDMFVHILRKYLGAYFFSLAGADAIVFTGGIGENAFRMREAVFAPLGDLGLGLDADKNRAVTGGHAGWIHADDSRTKVLVIAADEERMIARSVFQVALRDSLR